MQAPRIPCSRPAFTLVELLVVVAIIGVLAAILLPVLAKAPARADRIHCVNNLRQIGIAFHTWARDHDSALPMNVSTNEGGSLEPHRAAPNFGGVVVFSPRDFQAMSNELENPRILACRADKRRAPREFSELTLDRLNYFTGGQAALADPQSVLAGDSNLTNSLGAGVPLSTTGPLLFRWTPERHQERGNVLFADGHVDLALTLGFTRVSRDSSLTGGGSALGAPGSAGRGASAPTRGSPPPPDRRNGESSPDAGGTLGSGTGGSRSLSVQPRGVTVSMDPVRSPVARHAMMSNAPAGSAPSDGGAAAGAADTGETRGAWDTDGFRAVLGYAKAGYLFLILLALLMLLIWPLRERLRRQADEREKSSGSE